MKAAANGVVNCQRPRRLVGRGLDRRQRLGDRRPRDQPRRGRPGLGRRPGPVPDPRGRARPAPTTSATRTACPPRWLQLMRNSIASTIWRFSTTRMLHEYVERLYLPAAADDGDVPREAGVAAATAARPRPTRRTRAWPPGSRSPSRSTTTSRSATSAGCSPRSTTRPTCRCSRPSSATRASGSSLHYTGPLLEWLAAERPEFLERLRALVDRDQVELLGGGLYEPILASLPEHDRVDQLTRMADDASRRSPAAGRAAPGSPSASGSRTCRRRSPAAGYRWTILDDQHFRAAAIPEDEPVGRLHDRGPGPPADGLRDRAGPALPDPVRDVEDVIGYLRDHATEAGDRRRDDGRRRREVRRLADDLRALLGQRALGRAVLRGARGERATG